MDQNDLVRDNIQNSAVPYAAGQGNTPAIQAQAGMGKAVQNVSQASLQIVKQKRDLDTFNDMNKLKAEYKVLSAQAEVELSNTTSPKKIKEIYETLYDQTNALVEDTTEDGTPYVRHEHGKRMARTYMTALKGDLRARTEKSVEIANDRRNAVVQEELRQNISKTWDMNHNSKAKLWDEVYAPQMANGKSEKELRLLWKADVHKMESIQQGNRQALMANDIDQRLEQAITRVNQINTDPSYLGKNKAKAQLNEVEKLNAYAKTSFDDYKAAINDNDEFSPAEKKHYIDKAKTAFAGIQQYNKSMLAENNLNNRSMIANYETKIYAKWNTEPMSPAQLMQEQQAGRISQTFAMKMIDRGRAEDKVLHDKNTERQKQVNAKNMAGIAVRNLEETIAKTDPYQMKKHRNLIHSQIITSDLDAQTKTLLRGMVDADIELGEKQLLPLLKDSIAKISEIDDLIKFDEDNPQKTLQMQYILRQELLDAYNTGGMTEFNKRYKEMSTEIDDKWEETKWFKQIQSEYSEPETLSKGDPMDATFIQADESTKIAKSMKDFVASGSTKEEALQQAINKAYPDAHKNQYKDLPEFLGFLGDFMTGIDKGARNITANKAWDLFEEHEEYRKTYEKSLEKAEGSEESPDLFNIFRGLR